MITIAVTGATGLIGSRLMSLGSRAGMSMLPISRAELQGSSAAARQVDVFVHLAARVHQPGEQQVEDYIRDNVDLTHKALTLAERMAAHRFIFMSSIKAMGEGPADADQPLSVATDCVPTTPYGQSKLQAEQLALEFCRTRELCLDIIRIPLVVSAEAKGNIRALRRLIECGVPLPFGRLQGRRSNVDLDNVVDYLLGLCRESASRPCRRLHLVANAKSETTPELTRRLGDMLDKPVRLVALPVAALRLIACCGDFARKIGLRRFPFGNDELEKLAQPLVLTPGVRELTQDADA